MRKPSSSTRTHMINFRLNDEELQDLSAAAMKAQITMSEYCRDSVLKEISADKDDPLYRIENAAREMLTNVRKLVAESKKEAGA